MKQTAPTGNAPISGARRPDIDITPMSWHFEPRDELVVHELVRRFFPDCIDVTLGKSGVRLLLQAFDQFPAAHVEARRVDAQRRLYAWQETRRLERAEEDGGKARSALLERAGKAMKAVGSPFTVDHPKEPEQLPSQPIPSVMAPGVPNMSLPDFGKVHQEAVKQRSCCKRASCGHVFGMHNAYRCTVCACQGFVE